jgi:prepilin signal peptidase PulO-like enzyme (type II secretory pathway)
LIASEIFCKIDFMNILFSPLNTIQFSLCLILFLIGTFIHWRTFESFEYLFFKENDQECRSFIAEAYPTAPTLPPPQFPKFGTSLPFLAFTFVAIGSLLCLFNKGAFNFGQFICIAAAFFYSQRLSWFDIKHQILPDKDMIKFFLLAVLFLCLTPNAIPENPFISEDTKLPPILQEVCLSFILLAFFLYTILALFKYIMRKDGLGGGDIKLLFAFTPFLGIYTLLLTLPAACAIGLVWWIILKIMKTPTTNGMPFGPALFLSFYITICF